MSGHRSVWTQQHRAAFDRHNLSAVASWAWQAITHSVPKTISVHNSCKMFFSQLHDESCWKSWLDLNISALSLDREEKGACAVICTFRSITQIFEWFEWLDYSYKILERMTSTSHQQTTNDHLRKQQCLFFHHSWRQWKVLVMMQIGLRHNTEQHIKSNLVMTVPHYQTFDVYQSWNDHQ